MKGATVFVLLAIVVVSVVSKDLPKNFLWGTATAAYQIEGAYDRDGKGLNIWDVWSHEPGHIYNYENGDIADNSYDLWETDLEILKGLGVTSHRFSIAWSRILPNGRLPVNQKAILHYNLFIDGLIKANITPLVTLYHWDLPVSLQWNIGGWLSKDIVGYYKTYADVIFSSFGDRVKHFITFNEPLEFCYQGYGSGGQAPGRCSNRTLCPFGNTSTEPYICAHNVLLSHSAAVNLYRTTYKHQQGQIGITLDCTYGFPLNQNSPADRQAWDRYIEFQLGWFADPVFFGDYPQTMKERVGSRLPAFTDAEKQQLKGTWDFFGLNHYTSRYVTVPSTNAQCEPGWGCDSYTNTTVYNMQGQLIGPMAASDWLYIVPEGLRGMLNYVNARYGKPPIIVTENGVDVPGESQMTIDQARNDTFRVNYLSAYLGQLLKAVQEDNVNVIGYHLWSLLDNFEWSSGFELRFGIHYVDYKSHDYKRYENLSASWYRSFIAGHKQ